MEAIDLSRFDDCKERKKGVELSLWDQFQRACSLHVKNYHFTTPTFGDSVLPLIGTENKLSKLFCLVMFCVLGIMRVA